MKLVSMTTPHALSLPGIRTSSTMTFVVGASDNPLRDWQIHVRGPSVFLVSPPGWQYGGKPPTGKARRVYEIPRADVHLGWEMTDADKLDDVKNYTPAVIAPPATPKSRTTPAPAVESPPPQADVDPPSTPAPESSTSPASPPDAPDEEPGEDEIPPQYKAARKGKGAAL